MEGGMLEESAAALEYINKKKETPISFQQLSTYRSLFPLLACNVKVLSPGRENFPLSNQQ